MKKLYIAKDYYDDIVGVVLGESKEFVDVFYQGRNEFPHSIEEIDIAKLDEYPKVLTLITSEEVNVNDLDRFKKIRICKRGA